MWEQGSGPSPTIRVLLQRVGDQTAVIRTRWQQVRDAIVVIIIITLIPLSVLVCVQLGAVDDSWTVVPRVLVAVTVTGRERLLLVRTHVVPQCTQYTETSNNKNSNNVIPVLVSVTGVSNQVVVRISLKESRSVSIIKHQVDSKQQRLFCCS